MADNTDGRFSEGQVTELSAIREDAERSSSLELDLRVTRMNEIFTLRNRRQPGVRMRDMPQWQKPASLLFGLGIRPQSSIEQSPHDRIDVSELNKSRDVTLRYWLASAARIFENASNPKAAFSQQVDALTAGLALTGRDPFAAQVVFPEETTGDVMAAAAANQDLFRLRLVERMMPVIPEGPEAGFRQAAVLHYLEFRNSSPLKVAFSKLLPKYPESWREHVANAEFLLDLNLPGGIKEALVGSVHRIGSETIEAFEHRIHLHEVGKVAIAKALQESEGSITPLVSSTAAWTRLRSGNSQPEELKVSLDFLKIIGFPSGDCERIAVGFDLVVSDLLGVFESDVVVGVSNEAPVLAKLLGVSELYLRQGDGPDFPELAPTM